MPSKLSRAEILAQIAALQAQLVDADDIPTRPVEQSGARAEAVQPQKTYQVAGPTPQQLAIVRSIGAVPTTDPVVIQGQIDAITTVITSGVNSAGYGDKRTEFRSLADLRQILNGLQEDLAAALGYGGRMRQIRMTTQADKGL